MFAAVAFIVLTILAGAALFGVWGFVGVSAGWAVLAAVSGALGD